MGKAVLLNQLVVSVNVLSTFHFYVMFQSIHFVLVENTKMFSVVNPWEGVTTELKWSNISGCFQKCNTFCFAFVRVWIRTKFQIMLLSISCKAGLEGASNQLSSEYPIMP